MSKLFRYSVIDDEDYDDYENFNEDISSWDVSNVTNMEDMFYSASSFNQPLEKWDVSNVTNMEYMFLICFFIQ